MGTTRRPESAVAVPLRVRVLSPLVAARGEVETEIEEIEAERRAFARFRDRVDEVEPVTASRPTGGPATRTAVVETPSGSIERVREAFRETVMAVDHYDSVYDEPLAAHAAAELSPEVASGLASDTSTTFTRMYKSALTAAADGAVTGRESFRDHLDAELASLDGSREALVDLLDGPGATDGTDRRSDAATRLDDVARARQETIQRRDPSARTDGHELCEYLYRDRDWTYPVLTAVARYRDAVE